MFRSFWPSTRAVFDRVTGRPPSHAATLAGRAARRMAASARQFRPGLWVVPAPSHYGYAVSVQFFGRDEWVICLVGEDLVLDRDWIPRELALRVLETNSRCVYGSFRLMDVGRGLALIHAQLCDSRVYSAEKLAEIGASLPEQYQQLLTQLYACDLILPGPLSPDQTFHSGRSH